MPEEHVTIRVTENDEDPEVGGFFAEFAGGWGRGHGSTQVSAMFSLVLLYAEQQEIDLSEQVQDLISSWAVSNAKLEQGLERHYGIVEMLKLGNPSLPPA